MTRRADELLQFYRDHRIMDQLSFYTSRRLDFDRAAGQAIALSAILLGLAAAASALAGGSVAPIWLWSVLATVLPAAATAVGAYGALYAFEHQSKIYGDAARAVRAAGHPGRQADHQVQPGDDDPAELVKRVEAALRQEQAHWGQLTSQIEIPDDTKA